MKKQKPLLQGIHVIAVSPESMQQVYGRISACENCSQRVSMTVEAVLDDILAKPNGVAAYILGESLSCPACKLPLVETTRVQLKEPLADADSLKSFAPSIEEADIVLIGEETLLDAQCLLGACEHCDDNAEMSFDYLFDAITGCDPSRTEYLMCRPARCPQCFREVTEKSLIIPR